MLSKLNWSGPHLYDEIQKILKRKNPLKEKTIKFNTFSRVSLGSWNNYSFFFTFDQKC